MKRKKDKTPDPINMEPSVGPQTLSGVTVPDYIILKVREAEQLTEESKRAYESAKKEYEEFMDRIEGEKKAYPPKTVTWTDPPSETMVGVGNRFGGFSMKDMGLVQTTDSERYTVVGLMLANGMVLKLTPAMSMQAGQTLKLKMPRLALDGEPDPEPEVQEEPAPTARFSSDTARPLSETERVAKALLYARWPEKDYGTWEGMPKNEQMWYCRMADAAMDELESLCNDAEPEQWDFEYVGQAIGKDEIWYDITGTRKTLESAAGSLHPEALRRGVARVVRRKVTPYEEVPGVTVEDTFNVEFRVTRHNICRTEIRTTQGQNETPEDLEARHDAAVLEHEKNCQHGN